MMHDQNHRVRFWLIVIGWFAYGQVLVLGLSAGYLSGLGMLAWELAGQFVPSIARLDESRGEFPRSYASFLLFSMPFLFFALLSADADDDLKGVRKKGTEIVGGVLFVLIGSSIFFAGFDSRRFAGSYFTFSLGASFLTLIAAYFFRLAYGLAAQGPSTKKDSRRSENEVEKATKILRSFVDGQAMLVIALPPIKDICWAIRFLGERYGMQDDCLPAFSDLNASPPIISRRSMLIATSLLRRSKVDDSQAG